MKTGKYAGEGPWLVDVIVAPQFRKQACDTPHRCRGVYAHGAMRCDAGHCQSARKALHGVRETPVQSRQTLAVDSGPICLGLVRRALLRDERRSYLIV